MGAAPQPGDFGVTYIPGFGGWTIWALQRLAGCGRASRYEHAFIVTFGDHIIQAEPGGAAGGNLPAEAAYSHFPLTNVQRFAIVAAAGEMVGTPYSWLDYVAIAAERLRLPSKRLRRYVGASGHMICSQLVDEAYRRAGVALFADGRNPGSVTPGDLAKLIGAG
jgi:cell wall-associated NlpC family hydrolase